MLARSMLIRRLVSIAAVMVVMAVFQLVFWSFWMMTVPSSVPIISGSRRIAVVCGLE